ncbi:MAG: hypothetical protein HY652_11005 [Acidobacteria bacterium]|nr:hypothetical protein [Acidobacteriota bacterium]
MKLRIATSRRMFVCTLTVLLATLAGAGAAWVLFSPPVPGSDAPAASRLPRGNDSFQMVDYQPLTGSMMCDLFPTVLADEKVAPSLAGDPIKPLRMVWDPYYSFAGIGVDPENHQIVVSDENRFNLLLYDRSKKYPGIAEPLSIISGPKTDIEYVCGVFFDYKNGEIFGVNNDTLDKMIVFSRDAKGNTAPLRSLAVDHGAWGVYVDNTHDEAWITTQHINKINVYRRTAQGDEKQLRFIQGPHTGLADPHGVWVDVAHGEIFVTNHGSYHAVQPGEVEREEGGRRPEAGRRSEEPTELPELTPSTGRFDDPSITVHSRTATGDAKPLRVIQGPLTRLNYPLAISGDAEHNEIAVANDGDNSILIFSRTVQGNVAPLRVLKGPATQIAQPTGVFIDTKNDELWVSNWGNHRANVYRRTAQGNEAPLRTIASAPREAPSAGIGNPGAMAYDPARQQILVPN